MKRLKLLEWDRDRDRSATADKLEEVLDDLEDIATELQQTLAERKERPRTTRRSKQ